MKKLLLVVLMVFAIGLTGCSKKNLLDEIKKTNKIIVATNAEFPPFEYYEDNEIVGFDMDLARLIAEELGIEIEILHMDFDAVIGAVASGRADIAIAGLTVSPEREKSVDFSKSYFNASQVVIVKEDNITITGENLDELIASLEGKKIGFQKGTVGEFYVRGSESWDFPGIKNATPTAYDNGVLAVNELLNGRIDAIVIDEMPARAFLAKNEGIKIINMPLTVEEYAIAIPKGQKDLKDFIDQVLDIIKEDGRFDILTTKYFG